MIAHNLEMTTQVSLMLERQTLAEEQRTRDRQTMSEERIAAAAETWAEDNKDWLRVYSPDHEDEETDCPHCDAWGRHAHADKEYDDYEKIGPVMMTMVVGLGWARRKAKPPK